MTATFAIPSGSLADRVCAFFAAHRDEELSTADIAQKFDCPKHSVPSCLANARSVGLLAFGRSVDDSGSVWTAGAALSAGAPASDRAPPPPKAKRSTRGPNLPDLDLDKLIVRTSVPLPVGRSTTPRWDLLFDRLDKVGQSIELPIAYGKALKAALPGYKKRTGRQCAVRIVDADHIGVWRTA